jgi:hypothetical protein
MSSSRKIFADCISTPVSEETEAKRFCEPEFGLWPTRQIKLLCFAGIK